VVPIGRQSLAQRFRALALNHWPEFESQADPFFVSWEPAVRQLQQAFAGAPSTDSERTLPNSRIAHHQGVTGTVDDAVIAVGQSASDGGGLEQQQRASLARLQQQVLLLSRLPRRPPA